LAAELGPIADTGAGDPGICNGPILLQKSARDGLGATIESQRANLCINLAYRGLILNQCCFLGHPKSFCNNIGHEPTFHPQARLMLVGGATVARIQRPLWRKAALVADMVWCLRLTQLGL
jgi:hypothetical protein